LHSNDVSQRPDALAVQLAEAEGGTKAEAGLAAMPMEQRLEKILVLGGWHEQTREFARALRTLITEDGQDYLTVEPL